MILYRFLKFFVKQTLKLYFGQVTIEGIEKIPLNEPLLITSNHQNAFLDPFILGAFLPSKLHFFTRSDVFKWWTRSFFDWLGMIPIYRIRDGYSSLAKNNQTFGQATNLFKKDQSILIFPEGNHGEHYFLRPLTKGASRIAIQSQKEFSKSINIVPVGINYFSHRIPRRKVLLVIGDPIDVSPYSNDDPKTLNLLRDKITSGMKSALVIPEENNNYEKLCSTVFRKENQPLSFKELRQITPKEVPSKQLSKHLIAWLFNPVPLLIIKVFLSKIQDVVFYSSFKYALGLVLFPIWWIVSFYVSNLILDNAYRSMFVVIIMIGTLFYSYDRDH